METTSKVLKIALQLVWLVISLGILYMLIVAWRGAPAWWDKTANQLTSSFANQVSGNGDTTSNAATPSVSTTVTAAMLLNLTTTQKTCVTGDLGASRLSNIQSGVTPSVAELNQVSHCFPASSSRPTSSLPPAFSVQ